MYPHKSPLTKLRVQTQSMGHGTNKSDELKCSRPQGVFYQGILVAIAYLQILH